MESLTLWPFQIGQSTHISTEDVKMFGDFQGSSYRCVYAGAGRNNPKLTNGQPWLEQAPWAKGTQVIDKMFNVSCVLLFACRFRPDLSITTQECNYHHSTMQWPLSYICIGVFPTWGKTARQGGPWTICRPALSGVCQRPQCMQTQACCNLNAVKVPFNEAECVKKSQIQKQSHFGNSEQTISNIFGSAPKERRRRRAEKRSSKRVFWRVRFFSSH